eukprot:GHVN01044453.1.p1 GENE.GHVN01044453.1~~GHVN01044453.1.p1  ORF type:complete len:207 (-),score=9.05 GHVN01044453.1:2010-2630(-)
MDQGFDTIPELPGYTYANPVASPAYTNASPATYDPYSQAAGQPVYEAQYPDSYPGQVYSGQPAYSYMDPGLVAGYGGEGCDYYGGTYGAAYGGGYPMASYPPTSGYPGYLPTSGYPGYPPTSTYSYAPPVYTYGDAAPRAYPYTYPSPIQRSYYSPPRVYPSTASYGIPLKPANDNTAFQLASDNPLSIKPAEQPAPKRKRKKGCC